MYITDNVYMIDVTKGAYAFAVRDTDGVVLIDTGMPRMARKIIAELKRENFGEIKAIMLTHHDPDHIGNAAYIQDMCGCGVYAGAEDVPFITGEKKRDGIKRVVGFITKAEPVKKVDILEGGSFGNIEIWPTPGHTPGHVCYIFDGVLFAGDIVRSRGGAITASPRIMCWDVQKQNESIKSFAGKFEWVCPAHGEPVKVSSLNVNYV